MIVSLLHPLGVQKQRLVKVFGEVQLPRALDTQPETGFYHAGRAPASGRNGPQILLKRYDATSRTETSASFSQKRAACTLSYQNGDLGIHLSKSLASLS